MSVQWDYCSSFRGLHPLYHPFGSGLLRANLRASVLALSSLSHVHHVTDGAEISQVD